MKPHRASLPAALLATLLAVLLALSLVSCAAPTPTTAPTATPAPTSSPTPSPTPAPTTPPTPTPSPTPPAAPNTTASDYEYKVVNGAVTITKYKGSALEVYMPDAIDGKTVKAVAPMAFASATITYLRFPDHCTTIGEGALSWCQQLEEIRIPATVTSIGSSLLLNTRALRRIDVDPANPKFTSLDGVLFDKAVRKLLYCPTCLDASVYFVPATVTSIGTAAFMESTIRTIVLPQGLATIGVQSFAFLNGTRLISIPASVTSLDPTAFDRCYSLECIGVDAANAKYAAVDGVLFDKAKRTLIQYPLSRPGADYRVPDGVRTVLGNAFESAEFLASVTFPTSLSTLGDWAFGECGKLERATFLGNAPATVGLTPFVYCAPSFTIHYAAGKTGWKNPWHGYPTQAD